MRRCPFPTPIPRRRAPGAVAAALAAALLLPACGGDGGRGSADRGGRARPTVVASIFPVADLVRQLAGDLAEVRVLLPPGANPATFDLRPSEARRLRDADLLILVGGALDAWVADLLDDAADGPRVLVLTEGMRLAGEAEGGGSGNPHIWLDPVVVRNRLVPRIQVNLVAVHPDAMPEIWARASAYTDSLTALHREIRERLRDVPVRSFVASHPAWLYFAHRYGLRPVGEIHPVPGREPSPRHLAALADSARAAGVRAVFAEPQLPSTAARALAGELGVEVRLVDPLGGASVPGRDSYLALMRHAARQFALGLGGGG